MPNLNDFAIGPVQGLMDLQVPGNVIEVQVDSAVVTPIIPGQALKQSPTTGAGLPKMIPITANTDKIAGFACFNPIFPISTGWTAGKILEMAMDNSVMHMTAGAAINPGATVEYRLSDNTVITSAGTNTKIGHVVGQKGATAAGDIIRVRIVSPVV